MNHPWIGLAEDSTIQTRETHREGGYRMATPSLRPGRNIAMKVPTHEYDATIAFYRDTLGLAPAIGPDSSIGFEFGGKNLWIDNVLTLSHAEIWLEIVTNDIDGAAKVLSGKGIVRRDEIEPLPEGFGAFWISSPASIIHLVCNEGESW